ncbi:MAG: PHP domain-containing protein [Coriobacteriales bacterium]|jgi:predicted metal-dependent phosphoesterase TrpH
MKHINFEMHCHTTCSDGVLTAAQLIEKAAECGLDYIAITDHDTVAAIPEALSVLPETMKLVPGVEISSADGDRDVHMLGYFIDTSNQELLASMANSRERRRQRSIAMVQKLEEAGYPISVSEFEASGVTINRSNVARALWKAGAVEEFEDAFKTLIGKGCPFYVERDDIDAEDAVKLIVGAGGMPVIAHPAHYGVVDLIEPLKKVGLAGVECYHSEQTPEESAQLVSISRNLGLLVTGGSDFHGDPVHPSVLAGNQPPQEDILAFLEAGRDYGFEA